MPDVAFLWTDSDNVGRLSVRIYVDMELTDESKYFLKVKDTWYQFLSRRDSKKPHPMRLVELGRVADIPNALVHALASKPNKRIATVTKEDGAWILSATSSPQHQGDLTLDCPPSWTGILLDAIAPLDHPRAAKLEDVTGKSVQR
ncbi:hypothetical protein C8J57DRAFT_1235838 [Mycena rebaudengoi]|nr:hypothetical protein C8J57DRAFT_1235838 [Mycena rebaudengoi]